jgi:hypothetical protein
LTSYRNPDKRRTSGRLAQVDRALVSGTRGRAFESRIARHNEIKGLRHIRNPFFIDLY